SDDEQSQPVGPELRPRAGEAVRTRDAGGAAGDEREEVKNNRTHVARRCYNWFLEHLQQPHKTREIGGAERRPWPELITGPRGPVSIYRQVACCYGSISVMVMLDAATPPKRLAPAVPLKVSVEPAPP